MPIRKRKPTSPGRRFQTVSDFAEITRDRPEKALTRSKPKTGGRNSYGRMTSRHRGGGHGQRQAGRAPLLRSALLRCQCFRPRWLQHRGGVQELAASAALVASPIHLPHYSPEGRRPRSILGNIL